MPEGPIPGCILVMEAIVMRLLAKLRSWYHSNDEVYFSEEFQRRRAQATLDYYVHVGDPTSA